MQAELLIVVAVLFAILGFFKGAVREVFSISGLAIAFILAPFLTNLFVEKSKLGMDEQNLSLTVTLVGTVFYMLTVRLGTIWHFRNVQKHKIRRSLDHLLGALIGTIKGAALTLVALHFLQKV